MKMKVFLMLVVCFFQELQSSSSFRPIPSRAEDAWEALWEGGKTRSDQSVSQIRQNRLQKNLKHPDHDVMARRKDWEQNLENGKNKSVLPRAF